MAVTHDPLATTRDNISQEIKRNVERARAEDAELRPATFEERFSGRDDLSEPLSPLNEWVPDYTGEGVEDAAGERWLRRTQRALGPTFAGAASAIDAPPETADERINAFAEAEAARIAASERIARQLRRPAERRAERASAAPAAPVPEAPTPEGGNYFDRFDAEPDAQEPGLRERMRLNFLDGFYRGSGVGAARLALMANLVATEDAPDIPPGIKRVNDELRQEYHEIIADLARYDLMRSFGT